MRALLDTDIVLDIILEREPFYADAAALWRAHELGTFGAHITVSTVLNAYYITRKFKDVGTAVRAVGELLSAVSICAVNGAALQTALAAGWPDYEDAVQHAAALACGLEAIVTRNIADYRGSTIPTYSPADFLRKLALA